MAQEYVLVSSDIPEIRAIESAICGQRRGKVFGQLDAAGQQWLPIAYFRVWDRDGHLMSGNGTVLEWVGDSLVADIFA